MGRAGHHPFHRDPVRALQAGLKNGAPSRDPPLEFHEMKRASKDTARWTGLLSSLGILAAACGGAASTAEQDAAKPRCSRFSKVRGLLNVILREPQRPKTSPSGSEILTSLSLPQNDTSRWERMRVSLDHSRKPSSRPGASLAARRLRLAVIGPWVNPVHHNGKPQSWPRGPRDRPPHEACID